jgi:hypothetical protein
MLSLDILRRQRQPDADFPAAIVGEPDLAAMVVDDFLDDRQAQPGALGLGRDVGLEGARQDLRREARTVVPDRERARPASCASVMAIRGSAASASASWALVRTLCSTWRSWLASASTGGRKSAPAHGDRGARLGLS